MRGSLSVLVGLVLAALFLCALPASAKDRDRACPTAPGQLRVTALGAYAVSLAWNAASDSSGLWSYRVYVSDGRELSAPQGATSLRLNWGLVPEGDYSFVVVAIDGAGNRSRPSNTVSVTLPEDETAPSVPSPSLVYAGSRSISLSWSASSDDGPRVVYQLFQDGRLALETTGLTATLTDLEAGTDYRFSLRAVDAAGNASAASGALTVSTPIDAGLDVTAPSVPQRFAVFEDYCGDVFLVWRESVDDRDPSSNLSYAIYVNGQLNEIVGGVGWAQIAVDAVGSTEFAVVAMDRAGNAAAAASATLVLSSCQ